MGLKEKKTKFASSRNRPEIPDTAVNIRGKGLKNCGTCLRYIQSFCGKEGELADGLERPIEGRAPSRAQNMRFQKVFRSRPQQAVQPVEPLYVHAPLLHPKMLQGGHALAVESYHHN